MSERVETQVCIVGAGPAGALLGALLLRAGIDVAVVERLQREEVASRARAGMLEHRTVQLLERHGLAGRLRQEGLPLDCAEFRTRGGGFLVEFAELTGGASNWVYPQQELVADLTSALLATGGQVRFDVEAVAIEPAGRPRVRCRAAGCGEVVIDCDFVAGCDGFHGVSRASMPADVLNAFDRQYEFQWLVVLAAAPPSAGHAVYALHPRGFAGHMLRSATQTRFYLQVPRDSRVEDWPDQRVWEELRTRLAREGWTLSEGPIVGRSLLELRSFVAEPMQHGPLFLVGDAAHVITPTGGKGMNLALQDADELASGLLAHYATGDGSRLAGYTEARLPSIWRAHEFSSWMVEVLHADPDDQPGGAYRQRLKEARLEHLRTTRSFAINFAENYVGVDSAGLAPTLPPPPPAGNP
jgi:p-hydroxybenzoate 3-monooxygenase